MADYGLGI